MKTFLMICAIWSVFPFSLFGKEEKVGLGDKAPVLTGVNQNGEKVDLQTLYDKGLVLVYFYPKADTPGCTAQACSLRDRYNEIIKEGIFILGVSKDSVEVQKEFKDKYQLPFDLIADEDREVMKAFKVPSILGFAQRQAYLVQNGVVVWKAEKASTKKQAEDILHAVKAIKK